MSDQRDAGTFGDAQRPAQPSRMPEDDPEKAEHLDHAGIRRDPPGQRHDLTPENSQGFTGEIGDRDRQFPGSEAAKRKIPRNEEDASIQALRDRAHLNPDASETNDPND
jgi:hypothetical protein